MFPARRLDSTTLLLLSLVVSLVSLTLLSSRGAFSDTTNNTGNSFDSASCFGAQPDSVQSGTTTSSANGVVSVSITAVDPTLSFLMFSIGLVGIATRRNMITVLMSIELLLNSVNLNLVAFSHQLGDLTGQIFAVFTITVAAGEAAVGLGILVALFRLQGSTEIDRASEMSG